MVRRFLLFLLTLTPAVFAGNWTGVLVDQKCYANLTRNVNPWDTIPGDRDMAGDVYYCAPRTKTVSFGLVTPDWHFFKLDAGGNVKAAAISNQLGRKRIIHVAVNGQQYKNLVTVSSMGAQGPGRPAKR
jgi:hypothetical protein